MRLLAAGSFALLAAHASAQDAVVSKVELIDCGIYSSRHTGTEKDAASRSGTHRIIEGNTLVKATREIPLRMGTGFGCKVVMRGQPEGKEARFTAVVRLPSGTNDPRSGAPRESLRGSRSYPIGAEGFVGYTFREGGVFAPGSWVLEIWIDDRKLAENAFTMKQ